MCLCYLWGECGGSVNLLLKIPGVEESEFQVNLSFEGDEMAEGEVREGRIIIQVP